MNLTPAMMRAIARPSAANDARIHKPTVQENLTVEGVDREGDLHDAIEGWLKSHGWYYVHSRMDRPTTTALGVPDFIAAAPCGLTFWIEAKRKGKKPTPEQLGVGMILEKLGHRYGLVHSMDEFLAVVDPANKQCGTGWQL